MKTITIKLRTVLFAALTLLALVCFAPAGKAQQLQNPGSPFASGFTQAEKQVATAAASKPVRKKTKKQKAEKGTMRLAQSSGCMDFLFIGWGH